MKFNVILQTIRLPFLLLTPVCVMLGASFVHYKHITIDYPILALVLLGAIMAHIGVNTLNEYLDFSSGLDLNTSRTPFSGGSGALPYNPEMATSILYISVISLTITILIGAIFIWQQGIKILPIGIVGLLLVITYTQWINRLPLLCLISPGFGFGILMVVGTVIVLADSLITQVWLVAAVPFFLVNNLLLLNQYPDIEPDRNAGRNHFPIALGIAQSNRVYIFFALLAFGTVTIAVAFDLLPQSALIALFPAPLSFYAWRGAIKHGKEIGSHSKYMAANVASSLLTPLLLAIGLFIG